MPFHYRGPSLAGTDLAAGACYTQCVTRTRAQLMGCQQVDGMTFTTASCLDPARALVDRFLASAVRRGELRATTAAALGRPECHRSAAACVHRADDNNATPASSGFNFVATHNARNLPCR
ncbi:Tetracycline transcriptional regulator, TetR-like, C-terminal [Phytophthora cactorum]|nr:Tetracycline transcriptional regulator, TetR-like, C-terminal [Phytophthora cactorum]